jgi:two-component system cell cycle response regulator
MKNRKPRILVVDDDVDMVDLVERILLTRSFQVITANNGADGLAIARVVKPDLILLDIMMPDMDGYEVCKLLKNDPGTSNIAIVMLSALGSLQDDMYHSFYSQVDDRILGYECGADEFLSKPIRAGELIQRVKFWTGFFEEIEEV